MCSKMWPSRSASASGQSLRNDVSGPSGLRRLRPYQREIAAAVLDSAFGRKGLTFSVEIARQGGKNELSAQLELLLLTLFITESRNIIKCSPTFQPQALISMTRLKDRLDDAGYAGLWDSERATSSAQGGPALLFYPPKNPLMSWGIPRTCYGRLTKRRRSAKRSTPTCIIYN
jgi:hypothetical protein